MIRFSENTRTGGRQKNIDWKLWLNLSQQKYFVPPSDEFIKLSSHQWMNPSEIERAMENPAKLKQMFVSGGGGDFLENPYVFLSKLACNPVISRVLEFTVWFYTGFLSRQSKKQNYTSHNSQCTSCVYIQNSGHALPPIIDCVHWKTAYSYSVWRHCSYSRETTRTAENRVFRKRFHGNTNERLSFWRSLCLSSVFLRQDGREGEEDEESITQGQNIGAETQSYENNNTSKVGCCSYFILYFTYIYR